ncbi:unnamed protein product [Orchesella dallaii]|uniref:Uncharacterized protein n=1 Tax=Orchesella dallaii TaxID=48710 RepID=A0ABP1REQ5_9HEXA
MGSFKNESTLIVLVFYIILISPHLHSGAESIVSEEVSIFFKNFYHCSLQFYTNAQDIHPYDQVFNFYAGVSPLTFLNNQTQDVVQTTTSRRYSNCSVFVLHSENFSLINETGYKPWCEYMFFIFGSNRSDVDTLITLTSIRLEFQAMFFAIFNLESVALICVSCENKSTIIHSNESLTTYKTLWSNLHHNLNGVYILMDRNLANSTSPRVWNCKIVKTFYTSDYDCAYYSLMNYLNFTVIQVHSEYLSSVLIHGKLLTYPIIDDWNVGVMKRGNLEMVPYAFNAMPYAYIMVLDHVGSNWKGIAQPFHSTTWICFLATSFIITLLISLQISNEFYRFNSLVPATLSVIGLFMDQPGSSVGLLLKNHPTRVIICWSAWSLGNLILGNFYKGTLSSFLSSVKVPIVPDSLHGVLESKGKVITQSSYYIDDTGHNKTFKSTFKNMILGGILGEGRNVTGDYGELFNRIEWVGDDAFGDNATVQILKYGRVFNMHTKKFTEIPEKFFFLDRIDVVSRFKMKLNFYSDYWVSNVNPLPVFMIRFGWVINKNYLYTKFRDAIARFDEAGIIGKWGRFSSRRETVKILKGIGETLENRNGLGNNLFQFVYQNEKVDVSESEPIRFTQLTRQCGGSRLYGGRST